MSEWLVLLAFEEEVDANAFVDSTIGLGGVEAAIGAGWHRLRATVELGPYREEDGDET